MGLPLPPLLKQKNMNRVLASLAPVLLVSIYFFGWRVLAVLSAVTLAGYTTEAFIQSRRNGKVTMACFVTCALLALSMPPTVPLWIAAVAAVVAIFFGKEAFGGFGKNVFNPAITGRAFTYVCFPVEMASSFTPVFRGFPGGFAHWSLPSSGLPAPDAITAATPLFAWKNLGVQAPLTDLFTGSIGGALSAAGRTFTLAAGSMGETSAAVICLSAAYLLFTKTARWQLMLSTLIGAAALNLVLRNLCGFQAVPPLAFTLTSGALLYAAVFMVTDPVSAPRLPLSQWLYGAFIGMMIVLLRFKSAFAGGVAFAMLLGNIVGPSFDLWLTRFKARNAPEPQNP